MSIKTGIITYGDESSVGPVDLYVHKSDGKNLQSNTDIR